MSVFGSRLQRLRKERKEKQVDVAELLGVLRTTYSAYERGVIVPPFTKIQKLAEHYNVSVAYLMGTINEREPNITKSNVPEISKQLEVILDELTDDLIRIDINGREMTKEEKSQLVPFIEGCMKMVEMFKNRGEE